MSSMSDILAAGLSVLSTVKGESVGYRTGTTGSFTALPGWTITQDRTQPEFHDADGGADVVRRTATLKGPLSPALAKGYQIEDGTTSLVWAVQGVTFDQQQICLLELVVVDQFAPDRKGQR
jgi:hypothetical protein